MRCALTLAMLLATSLLIGMIPATQAASAPTHGGVYSVTVDETWNTGSEINAIVIVEAGVTLTIEGDYTLPAGASITVAEGGTLRIEDGSLTGDAFSQAVRMIPGDSSLMVHSNIASGAFTLKIVAPSGADMSGWAVAWDDIQPQDMTGDSHEINFSAPKENFQLNFSLTPGSFTDLVVDHLEIIEGSTVTSTPAYMAEPVNTFMAAEMGTLFPLVIEGTAHVENSAITGAEVMITGAVTTVNSDLTASGPLNVQGTDSSLSMQGGSVTMSSTDHDVNLDGVASLTWDGTTGTGDLIDRWERNIEQQEIHIPIGSTCTSGYCVEYAIHNVGPSEGTVLRNNVEGVAYVPARTVEIGWSDGSIWTENASIEVTNFRTAWNQGSTSSSWSEGVMVPLPWDISTFEILPHLAYPIISVDTVNIPDETGQIGRSIPVEITVTNSGEDDAAIFIRCNIAGTERYADMTPTYSAMQLDAGETETLNANWTSSSKDDNAIDCYVETPVQFMDTSAFIAKLSANSTRDGENATVSWGSSQTDSSPMLIMLVGLVVTVVTILVVAVRFAAAEKDDDREINHDEERVDRFAEMMDEEDEN